MASGFKVCADCGTKKRLVAFYADRRAKDGHDVYCKLCRRARVRAAQSPERQRASRSKNPEHYRAYQRLYMRIRRAKLHGAEDTEAKRALAALRRNALQSGNR